MAAEFEIASKNWAVSSRLTGYGFSHARAVTPLGHALDLLLRQGVDLLVAGCIGEGLE